RQGAEWQLWGRSRAASGWGAPEQLSSGSGPHFHHRMASDRQGRLWLVWQGFERGQSDIFLRAYEPSAWSPARRISESAGSEWEPAVAADGDGRAWVVWDPYGAGRDGAGPSYDVLARSVTGSVLSPIVPVATSARSEAHASIAIDSRNRPWI